MWVDLYIVAVFAPWVERRECALKHDASHPHHPTESFVKRSLTWGPSPWHAIIVYTGWYPSLSSTDTIRLIYTGRVGYYYSPFWLMTCPSSWNKLGQSIRSCKKICPPHYSIEDLTERGLNRTHNNYIRWFTFNYVHDSHWNPSSAKFLYPRFNVPTTHIVRILKYERSEHLWNTPACL